MRAAEAARFFMRRYPLERANLPPVFRAVCLLRAQEIVCIFLSKTNVFFSCLILFSWCKSTFFLFLICYIYIIQTIYKLIPKSVVSLLDEDGTGRIPAEWILSNLRFLNLNHQKISDIVLRTLSVTEIKKEKRDRPKGDGRRTWNPVG